MSGRILAALAVLTFLAACDPYYGDPEIPSSKLAALPAPELDARIAAALDQQPVLPRTPFLLAVSDQPPFGERLPAEDANEPTVSWLSALKDAGITPVNIANVCGCDSSLDAVLESARKGPAEVFLAMNETVQTHDESTPLALFYPTLVGLLVAPGSYYERTVNVDATLWDLQTNLPILSVSARGTDWQLRPYAWIDGEKIVTSARRKALTNLAKALVARLRES